MIYIKINEDNCIYYQHNAPFDPLWGLNKTEEELLQEGYLLESILEPEKNGLLPIKKYDPVNNVVYYTYTEMPPMPKTVEEQLQDANAKIAALQTQVAAGEANQAELSATITAMLELLAI